MFREINQVEDIIINRSLSLISPQIPKELKSLNYNKWIHLKTTRSKQFFPKIFMVPNYLASFLPKRIFDIHIEHAGVYFGTIKRGEFLLSLEGAEFLFQLGYFPKNQIVIVNESGEKATLYRNDISSEMISNIAEELSKESIILIVNQYREVLSLARYDKTRNIDNIPPKLLTLIDKGYYLRAEQ